MAMPCGELNLRSFSGRSGQFSQGGGVQRLKNEFYTTKRTGAGRTIGTVLVCAPRVFSWAKLFPQGVVGGLFFETPPDFRDARLEL